MPKKKHTKKENETCNNIERCNKRKMVREKL